MSIWYLLVNTLFSTLSAILVYVFLKVNFVFKCSKNRLLVFLALFGFINGAMSTAWTQFIEMPNELQFIKPIIMMLLSIESIRFVLKVDWSKTVLSLFIIMIATGVGNFVAPVLFNSLGLGITTKSVSENVTLYFLVNIVIHTIAAIIIFIYPVFSRLKKVKNFKSISVLLGITILVMVFNNSIYFSRNISVFSSIMALLSSLLFFIIVIILINKYQKSEELKEEQRQQIFYNESLSNTLQELRRVKHDQNNHLSVLNYMIQNKKCDEAIKYISEISATINTINTTIYNIKNVALFAIISLKMDMAESSGIEIDLKTLGVIDSIPNIKVSDLCEIIGIFLDNAIEAAQLSDKKTVGVNIFSFDTCIDIKISNSCDDMPPMGRIKEDGFSIKGEDRGHGLAIADKILSKYKTVLNSTMYDDFENKFIQLIKIERHI